MKNEISNYDEKEYTEILNTAIAQINVSRNAIALQINSTVSSTYWNLGKLFYERYSEADKKLLQAVAVLQWGHNLLLINKKLSDEEVYFYATESISKNWNRDLLLNAIKMNMYLSLLDKLEKEETENQSIGIILCAEKDHLDVEFALQDVNKPIAVSDYELLIPKQELQTLVLNEMKKNRFSDQGKLNEK